MGHPHRVANRGADQDPQALSRNAPPDWTPLSPTRSWPPSTPKPSPSRPSTWEKVICALIDDLNRIQAHRTELATDIAEAFLQHPLGQILHTLTGFGPRTGARTLAEIGDPHRFKNGSRLAAYAGLAPVNHRSGKSTNRTSQHPGSNHRLKNAMFLAAFVAIQHDPTAKAYYQRKRSEGKHHNAAVIRVARRRCDLILAMFKTQTPYNPQHPRTDLEKR